MTGDRKQTTDKGKPGSVELSNIYMYCTYYILCNIINISKTFKDCVSLGDVAGLKACVLRQVLFLGRKMGVKSQARFR